MNNVMFSVIMSTKDTDEKYLKDSINSILQQTYKNFEFIIIDDGGKNDFNVISNFEDERIKIIRHKHSIGLTKSLNEAIKISKGKYIARMDSDDISLPKRLEVQLNFMEKNLNIDVCSTYSQHIGKDSKKNIDIFYKPYEKKAELFFYNKIIHPSIVIRKSFIEKYNIKYDESFKYSQDYELWDRISKFGNIYVIPEICLLYRIHDSQISIAKLEEQNALCQSIVIRNLKLLNLESNMFSDFVMYLSGKNDIKYNNKDAKAFSKKLIENNKKNALYDKKIFKCILYYRLMVINLKEKKLFSAIKYGIYCNIIKLILKKMYINIKQKKYDFSKKRRIQ